MITETISLHGLVEWIIECTKSPRENFFVTTKHHFSPHPVDLLWNVAYMRQDTYRINVMVKGDRGEKAALCRLLDLQDKLHDAALGGQIDGVVRDLTDRISERVEEVLAEADKHVTTIRGDYGYNVRGDTQETQPVKQEARKPEPWSLDAIKQVFAHYRAGRHEPTGGHLRSNRLFDPISIPPPLWPQPPSLIEPAAAATANVVPTSDDNSFTMDKLLTAKRKLQDAMGSLKDKHGAAARAASKQREALLERADVGIF